MDNKNIFAHNLKMYMDLNGKSRNDICEALGFSKANPQKKPIKIILMKLFVPKIAFTVK